MAFSFLTVILLMHTTSLEKGKLCLLRWYWVYRTLSALMHLSLSCCCHNNGVLLTCFPTETQLLAPPSPENERKKERNSLSMCRSLQSGLQFCKHSFLYSLISNNILFFFLLAIVSIREQRQLFLPQGKDLSCTCRTKDVYKSPC